MKISVPSRMWQPGARRDRTQMLTYCFCFRLEPADETRRTDSGISAAEKRRRRRCGGNRRSGGCDRNPGTACSARAVHASAVLCRAAIVGTADRFCIGPSDRHAVRRPAVRGRCDPVRRHRFRAGNWLRETATAGAARANACPHALNKEMMMSSDLSHGLHSNVLEMLFLSARTHNAWKPAPVADETLKKLYDLLKMAPTSANCSLGGSYSCVAPRARKS